MRLGNNSLKGETSQREFHDIVGILKALLKFSCVSK